ncbi:putative bifunctional diguanylate cyclase/phosphodiesterase [Cognaticolwellia mytili]|uniref:putative bifunctional diguanylate cyclase/phosphodiesterase n=1 Tax=Cognaticolwellia mytili TaxID=1888913 RepID=UPI000A16E60F|nr:EAL domain-containing protein [Cognaticolwellia mytili]
MMRRSREDKILLTVTAFALLGLFPFLVLSVKAQDKVQIIIDLVAILGITVIFSGVWFTKKTQFYSGLLAIFIQITMIGAIYAKGAILIYWVFPIIIAGFYLLPTIIASILNALLIFIACFLTYTQFNDFELLRIIAALILTNLFSLAFSLFMKTRNQQLFNNEKLSRLRNNILELIASSAKLSEILPAILVSVEREYHDAKCSILLLDDSKKHLIIGAAPSFPDFYNEAIDGVEIGYGVGSCGTAAYTGKRVIVEDISSHPFWSPWTELAKRANLASCWSEPIIDNQGNILGTFAIYHKKISAPKAIDFILIEQFANLVRIAMEREKADKLIWQQANFDSLTHLPNRNLLYEHLIAAMKNAKRDDKQLAVAMLDLDNFKDVNDSLGHATGDALLVECSKRIKNSIRKNDIVARLGGDEFVVLFVGAQFVENIVQKLLEKLAQPYELEQKNIYCSVSIGIAIYPNDALDRDTLLRSADQAMYGAKAQGRNNVHYFTENMRTDVLRRIEMVEDLRVALVKNQFHLVYQPITNLETEDITKAEALIRWQHPTKGLISPLEFIPLAEETGLIIEISDWIFYEVIRQVKRWRKNYCSNLKISINTSPIQYKNKGEQIINWIDALAQKKLAPQAIGIEITENLLMENQAEVVTVLDKIRLSGIAISIDDFGTGYSSFSYLKNFSFDYLKIDKSFIQNMSANSNDLALCEAIIVMAKKLNIKVIAEGIETEQQRQLLSTAGCDFGQGYLLDRPLSANDFEELLISNHQT